MQTIGCPRGLSAIPRHITAAYRIRRRVILRHPKRRSIRTRRHSIPCKAKSSSRNELRSEKQPTVTVGPLDYVLGRGTYQFLTVAFTVTAAMAVFGDVGVFEKIFLQKPTVLNLFFFRTFGSLIFVPAAMCYCLQASVAANRIDSPTYKRMGFAVAFAFLVLFGSKYYYISQGMSMAPLAVFYSNLLHILPTVSYLKVYGFSEMSNLLPGLISGIKSLFQPDNLKAMVYAAMAGVIGILATLLTTAPRIAAATLMGKQSDIVGELLIRAIGSMSTLLAIACFTLKDAADTGRLGFLTRRALNFGMSVASIANTVTMYYLANKLVTNVGASETLMTPLGWNLRLVVCLVLSLFCGYEALMSTET